MLVYLANTTLVKKSILTRPETLIYLKNNFKFNTASDEKEIKNLFNETEQLLHYRKFYNTLEEETSKSKIPIKVVFEPISYVLNRDIFKLLKIINTVEKYKESFYGNYAEKELINTKSYLWENMEKSFSSSRRCGEIFVAGSSVVNIKVKAPKNSFYYPYYETQITKLSFFHHNEVFDKDLDNFITMAYSLYLNKIKD